jgi:hypothetical protein
MKMYSASNVSLQVLLISALDRWLVLSSGFFNPLRKALGTHQTWGWAEQRASLEVVLKIQIAATTGNRIQAVQLAINIYWIHCIQSVSGGKVNILESHSIGHSKQKKKKKVYMYMCPIPNSFRDRAISLYSSTTVDKKEILLAVSNNGIFLFKWQSWYSLPSVIHFQKFHTQHQCTLQLVWGHGVLKYVALSRNRSE